MSFVRTAQCRNLIKQIDMRTTKLAKQKNVNGAKALNEIKKIRSLMSKFEKSWYLTVTNELDAHKKILDTIEQQIVNQLQAHLQK